MGKVQFLQVNVAAFCCFFLLLITFMAAKKNREVRTFIAFLGVLTIWSGASVLMRLQVPPGVNFWFYVSLLALFTIALCCFFFVCNFVREKGVFLKIAWSLITAIILILTTQGIFLQPPTPAVTEAGKVVFHYENISWRIAIPLVVLLIIVLSTAKLIRKVVRERGLRSPGLLSVIFGCVIMALGNMVSIMPGNVFPWDQFSGIICAALLTWALYKKHLFNLKILISRTLLVVILAAVLVVFGAYYIGDLKNSFVRWFGMNDGTATAIVAIATALIMAVIYQLLRKLLSQAFSNERQQDKLLSNYSNAISQSLNVNEIMQQLVEVIQSEIPVERVIVCLPEKNKFISRCSNSALDSGNVVLSVDSPCLTYLKEQESYLLVDEFRSSPLYQSMWQSEKELFDRIGLGCMLALRDQEGLVGAVLLSRKDKGAKFSYTELSFLTTVSSITAIAVKNAALYEQVYREARIDSLTGVYNYRYFVEQIEEQFALCRGSSLALIYVDLDDFKLYNQLYGAAEGDKALVRVADILRSCVDTNGLIFRSSGKVFALLMPHYDERSAEALAQEIRRQVAAINAASERQYMRPLTVSCGICVSPYAASSGKELMENADLATYHAKAKGKQGVNRFKGNMPENNSPRERALRIIRRSADSAYQQNETAIRALTAAIDAKDHYTYQHSENVARYSAILAAAYGMNDEQVLMIYEAGLLHDIGKISIPENILSKDSKLTDEEYEIIKGHVNNSIDMIRHLPAMDHLIPAVVGHHERWNGRGYPRGIAGTEIPLSARCLAVADSFDAMTTNRPYRNAMSLDYAIDQLEKGCGKEFDPELSTLFVQLVQAGEIRLNETEA
jgi:diguanylate cyclase (GGDEF)-like protein/putative nucleotidyltransferase with HDIG domain